MNSKNNFRPTQREIDDVTRRSRKDALKGSLVGGLVGALAGAKRRSKLVGAAIGATAGHFIGAQVGRHEAAKDTVKSRAALLRNMEARLDNLESFSDEGHESRAIIAEARQLICQRFGAAVAARYTDHDLLAVLHGAGPKPSISRPPVLFSRHGASDRDSRENFRQTESGQEIPKFQMTPARYRIAQIYGYAVAQSLTDEELTDSNAAPLAEKILKQQQRSNGAAVGGILDEALRQFAFKVGQKAIDAMSPAELNCHLMSAQRRGLIELDRPLKTTDFGMEFAVDTRIRAQDGTFTPGGEMDPSAARRAYSPKERHTGRDIAAVSAGGTAAGLAAAVLAHKRLRKAKAPRLNPGGQQIARFARGDDDGHPVRNTAIAGAGLTIASIFAGRKLRKNRLPKLKTTGKVIYIDADPVKFARNMRMSLFAGGPRKLVRRPRRGGKLLTARHFGVGSIAAEGLIDALGLGDATASRRKKVVTDSGGNALNPSFLPNPETRSSSSFSAIARAGSIAARYLPEAATIGGADLVAERANAAIEARKKRQKKLLRDREGLQATSGLPSQPTTMSALQDTLNEFSDHPRKRAEDIGAVGAGGVAGAIAGLKYDQGKPVSGQLKRAAVGAAAGAATIAAAKAILARHRKADHE